MPSKYILVKSACSSGPRRPQVSKQRYGKERQSQLAVRVRASLKLASSDMERSVNHDEGGGENPFLAQIKPRKANAAN